MSGIVRKLLLLLIIVIFFTIFHFWAAFEKAKSRDIQRLTVAQSVAVALSSYNHDRFSYPFTSPDGLELDGVKESLRYIPLASDGVTQCVSKSGCPDYAIELHLETNSVAKKGVHLFTQNGLQ